MVAPNAPGMPAGHDREYVRRGSRDGGMESRPTPVRMLLQQRAPETIRRHVVRAVVRVLVLVAGDLTAFLGARAILRLIRDSAVLGDGVARALAWAIPPGSFAGWQLAIALLLGLLVAGAYRPGDFRRDPRRLVTGVALAAGLVLWGDLWLRGATPVLMQFVATVAGVWGMVVLVRLVIDRAAARFWLPLQTRERVLFVGDPNNRETVDVCVRLERAERMATVGWVTPPSEDGTPEGRRDVAALGTADDFWHILQHVHVDTVVLCGSVSDLLFDMIVEASAAAGCRLLAVSRYEGVGRLRPSLVWYHRLPFVELTVPALRGQQLVVKRLLDVMISGFGLVLFAPVFAVIAAAIRADSRGPAFFSQERVGMGGRKFRLVKFRTMRNGADAEKDEIAHLNHTGDARLFKIPNDPRVTRLGAILRRWSLDELPQLWNVFKGEMSLVGPRPFFESDLAAYSDHHFGRLGAKPGITGLWQVKGRSAIVDFEEVVRLDREYIDQWSLMLDIRILLQTLPALFRRTGAY